MLDLPVSLLLLMAASAILTVFALTAPLIACWAFPKNAPLRRSLLIGWNLVCLALLCNIVGTAVAASPYFAASFGFELLNRAVLFFPFVWLPCLIVPVVLLAHLAALRKLLVPVA